MHWTPRFMALLAGSVWLAHTFWLQSAPPPVPAGSSTWPQEYAVQQNKRAGVLTLSTPYYEVHHALKKGGAICQIRLTWGRATNLLVTPLETTIRDGKGKVFSDLNDRSPRITRSRKDRVEIVEVTSKLLDERGGASGIVVKSTHSYHWGYVKIHREFKRGSASFVAREVRAISTVLQPGFSDYGYREGLTEQEKAPPFSFGSCVWGKFTAPATPKPFVQKSHVPRYVMFADPGMEGLEWFFGSNLEQWESGLPGRRGQGDFTLQWSQNPPGIAWSVSPLRTTEAAIPLPPAWELDFYLGVPLIEPFARKPWFHASFNRNRGEWVTSEQMRQWTNNCIQTVHCHNDGDYYDDGLFWRDGAYPPYPDMERHDQVIAQCHQAGIRVATYFSNKELHPSTKEFLEHGTEWGRQNAKGNLQHNIFRGTNEFGVQMCLRSGWLDFLKKSIDRVLTNHHLDGVYYDWNVALLCCNGLHEGKRSERGAGHWDIDELLNLMEWTRSRVGPKGLVIVHNTTTPMFATENFADHVVANEWGYGKWSAHGPELKDLPLEWSLVGARSRGVISYGQLDGKSPRRLHRLFALEALLSGVAPWPASLETSEVYSVLKPIEPIESCRFVDWRNQAALVQGTRCATAVYSRPGSAFILVGNMNDQPSQIHCTVRAAQLPFPISSPKHAYLFTQEGELSASLDVFKLISGGVDISVPADSVMLIKLQ